MPSRRRPVRRRIAAAALVACAAFGVAAGAAGFTFGYADGASYMTNDPTACANCHVMQDHLDGWRKSSHHAVATCNDCHTPAGFFAKYATKASNGWHHSLAFTSGEFHEPIRIKPHNLDVVEGRCRDCHGEIVDGIEGHGAGASCVRCHASVGHPR